MIHEPVEQGDDNYNSISQFSHFQLRGNTSGKQFNRIHYH